MLKHTRLNAEKMATLMVYRRKLNLDARYKGGSSYYSFKRLAPGAFNLGLTGSTCTALPWRTRAGASLCG